MILDDLVRHENLPHITYTANHTEPGKVKVLVTYSLDENYGNITAMNPFFTYEIVDLLYGSSDRENRNNDLVLDNVRFSSNFLSEYYQGRISKIICYYQ